jgi:nucleoside-diphosphate-sugar epimerase
VTIGPNDVPKLLVLGQHGFIGCNLVGAGLLTGMHVLGFSLGADIDRGDRILRSLDTPQVPSVSGDATNVGQIREVLKRYRPDVVVSAVGQIPPSPNGEIWLGGYEVNYLTATATVDALAEVPPDERPFLLWVGSEEEYGAAPAPWSEANEPMPTTAYGTSKLAATTIVTAAIRSGVVGGCVVRLPLVFGGAQSPSMPIPRLITAALAGRPIPLLPGDPIVMLAYAPDIAEWMVRLASAYGATAFPPVINAPGYRPMSQNSIVKLLDSLFPNGLIATPRTFDWAPEPTPSYPDISLAEDIGMGPVLETPLEHALAETINWYDRNRWFWEED